MTNLKRAQLRQQAKNRLVESEIDNSSQTNTTNITSRKVVSKTD